MQPINDGPRAGLNPDAIRSLIQGDPSIEITYGCEWLNNRLAPVGDVSEFMSSGSTVSSDCFATIHRTCSLNFDSDVPFNYLTDFVHPYVIVKNLDTDFEARFNLGVYTLQTPTMNNSRLPSVLTFTGYDLLYYLNQPIGDTFQMEIGFDPADIAAGLIATAVPGSVVEYEPSGEVTARIYTWPFDDQNQYTYLQIVNDLLRMIGYSPVWVDWDGNFQLHAFVDPGTVETDWDFNLTASDNIVAEARSSTQDFFDVPNYWRFVMNNLGGTPVEGINMVTYVDGQPENPGSYVNRGRYVKKIAFVDATSFQSLWAQALDTIVTDLMPGEVFAVNSSPFPLAWHKDVFSFFDPNIALIQPALSSLRRVQSVTWTQSLDGNDTQWTWQTLNAALTVADSGNYTSDGGLELVPNPSFESGNPPVGWYASGNPSVLTTVANQSYDGVFSARIAATASTPTTGNIQVGTVNTAVSGSQRGAIPVIAGQSYEITGRVRVDGAIDPGRVCGIYVDWWNARSGTATYISTSGDDFNIGSAPDTPTDWTILRHTVTAPAGAVGADIYVTIVANGTAIPAGEGHLVDLISMKAVS